MAAEPGTFVNQASMQTTTLTEYLKATLDYLQNTDIHNFPMYINGDLAAFHFLASRASYRFCISQYVHMEICINYL